MTCRWNGDEGAHRHEFMACLVCGYRVDAATALGPGKDDHAPADGDLAVCLACAAVNVYVHVGGAIALRLPTADERAEFAADPTVQRTVQTAIELRDRDSSWPKGTKP